MIANRRSWELSRQALTLPFCEARTTRSASRSWRLTGWAIPLRQPRVQVRLRLQLRLRRQLRPYAHANTDSDTHTNSDAHSNPDSSCQIQFALSRAMVGTGDAIVLNAFIVTGPGPKQVLARGLGPSITGLPAVLADPALDLRSADGTLILSNDNWRDDPVQEALILASGLAPTNNLEAAMVVTLNPGSYTVVLRGVNNTSGRALNEVFDLIAKLTEQLNRNWHTRA